MNKRLWIDYSKVRSALDFGNVLNHYQVEYPADRNQVKVLCPFHDEKTPSLSINLEDGKFQCFGCGEKGNTLEFVVRMEGKNPDDKDDLYTGAEIAIAIMGRSPEEFTKRGTPQKAQKTPLEAPKPAKRPLSRPEPLEVHSDDPSEPQEVSKAQTNPVLDLKLTLNPEHPFLADRGITPDVAREFGLGYCDQGIMKHRIAIPIHNERGELVAYAGRYADQEIPSGTERYRLPKKFHKSLVLFNLHRAKELGKRHLVIVEGYWSAIRLHREGIPVAALLGTSCSPDQAELVRATGFKFVTLLLDGDEPGRKAAPDILMMLARQVYVRVIELPEGVKPDKMSGDYLDRLR